MRIKGLVSHSEARALLGLPTAPKPTVSRETVVPSVIRRPVVREEDVQANIIASLSTIGLRVLQTSHRVKMVSCPHCQGKFRPPGNYGATKGVPDLLVRCPEQHDPGAWIGLEVKGPKTRLSPEQKELEQEQSIIIVRSLEDALRALE